jgi:ketosteroid isomerase-like protein
MRTVATFAAIALAGCALQASRSSSEHVPACLAAAESAFAAHSVRAGMRAAFLAHFADDGVFVRDGWTNAKAYLAGRPDPPIVLDWRPVHAEAAASGEIGLSTGPWRLTSKARPDAPSAFGQFVSVWKRDPGKPWQVAVDLGISHPQPSLWDERLETVVVAAGSRPAGLDLAKAEERFTRDTASGVRSAYASHGSERLRFYRNAAPPAVGKAAALASSAMTEETFVWTIEAIETSRSNDFGYARGRYALASAPAMPLGYYLRVWRLERGEWRIALDITNPAPRP